MKYFFLLIILFSTNCFSQDSSIENKELKIIRITPDGQDVPTGRQIVIQFNSAVVPLGKMDRKSEEIPITIEPKLNCEWRWLSESALSCNLNEKDQLQPATKYEIKVSEGIKTEDGSTTRGIYNHSFITKRPDVHYVNLEKWLSPSDLVISISFNQEVTKKSVEDSLIFLDREKKELSKVVIHEELNKPLSRVWKIKPNKSLPLDSNIVLQVKPGLDSSKNNIKKELGISDREVISFYTFPEFKFLGVKCYTNDPSSEMVFVSGDNKDNILCDPLRGASLVFNSPVTKKTLKDNLIITPNIDIDAETSLWGEDYDLGSELNYPRSENEMYNVWLPAGIKANTEYSIKTKSDLSSEDKFSIKNLMPYDLVVWIKNLYRKILGIKVEKENESITDEFNRALKNSINVNFKTDNRNPNLISMYKDSVLEKNTDSEVPIYVNNLEKTIFEYNSLTSNEVKLNQTKITELPKIENIQYAIPLKVRELLNQKSGVIYGKLEAVPYPFPNGEPIFSQVTPFQVHLKLGHFNTLVWVTDLKTGKPVENAKVKIYKDELTKLEQPKEIYSEGVTNKDGLVYLDGTNKIDPNLDFDKSWQDSDPRLFVRVDKDDDIALLPVSYSYLINSYRSIGENVYYDNKELHEHIKTWGITAQGIYRQGDTIQYKIFVRDQNNNTLISPEKESYSLKILDPLGKKVNQIENITLDEFGSFSGEYKIPEKATLGWYQYKLSSNFGNKKTESYEEGSEEKGKIIWNPLRVLVSDFTPSPFKVTNQISGDSFGPEDKLKVSTQGSLYSGGAYTDSNVRITSVLKSKAFRPKNSLAKDFNFGSDIGTYDSKQIFERIDVLDNKGENITEFTIPNQEIYYGNILVESSVQDDRGKYISSQSYADYRGVDRFIGLKTSDWIFKTNTDSKINYVVTDHKGNLVPDNKIKINIEKLETKVSKVKGAGNTYLNEYIEEWKQVSSCEDLSGISQKECFFKPEKAGRYKATGSVIDTKNKTHVTEISFYVTGSDYVEWNNSNDSSLEIIPEKTEYKVGDTAKYLIKNPYPGAEALITIERYGVIDKFIKKLEGSSPVIEFEIKPDYLPGFYFSALVFSPRVETENKTETTPEKINPSVENQLDLGKPSFKMGYSSAVVKDQYKEILVGVKTDKETYKPREKVKVKLSSKIKNLVADEAINFSVTVLDESVLDLLKNGKSQFDPYLGLYKLESLDLRNYSLITNLIGRQKFEKKGANPGGDGGSDLATRNIFKYVSYWNPSIKADKNGDAEFEFEVPDNLTGFRILAVAVSPTDRLGLGEGSFKVNKPTEIRAVTVNQVSEGDQFLASFNIINRTDIKRELEVIVDTSGDVLDNITGAKTSNSVIKKISLEPYKRENISIPVKTSLLKQTRTNKEAGFKDGEIKFKISAKDNIDSDSLEHKIPVNKIRSLENSSFYSSMINDSATVPVKIPNDIHSDIGDISVILSSSTLGNISGAFKYMKDYPYLCWEQRLTKGVMASHYEKLKAYLPENLVWEDAVQVTNQALSDSSNFQAPNGGMGYYIGADQYVDPYLSAYTALSFTWLREQGHTIPKEVEDKLLGYLSKLVREDILPSFYNKGMSSTVRAIALYSLAKSNRLNISDIERYKSHVNEMSLIGKTYFLASALKVEGGEQYGKDTLSLILSHASESSGKLIFQEELGREYERILSSNLRENCAILSLLIQLRKYDFSKDLIKDLPEKLVRTITQTRGSKDHWENTQENMFCMNGLIDYVKEYEKVSPNFSASVKLDNQELGNAQFKSVKDAPSTFSKNLNEEDINKDKKVQIEKLGEGRLYYQTKLSYSPKDLGSKNINSGIEIRREYSVQKNKDGNNIWELIDSTKTLKPSDIVRVDIYLSLPAPRNFVVVNDPVPGGFEPINSDLQTSSVVDSEKGNFKASGGSYYFNLVIGLALIFQDGVFIIEK